MSFNSRAWDSSAIEALFDFPTSVRLLFDCEPQLASVKINGTSQRSSQMSNWQQIIPRVAWMRPGSFLRHNSSHGWHPGLKGCCECELLSSPQFVTESQRCLLIGQAVSYWPLIGWWALLGVTVTRLCENNWTDWVWHFPLMSSGHVTSHLSRVTWLARVPWITRASHFTMLSAVSSPSCEKS